VAADRSPEPGTHRFFFAYLRHELRRRLSQALLIAVGLGFGVGLVVTVTSASAAVSSAQGTVLHALYGIGTDITVTGPAPAAANGPAGGSGSGLQHPGALLSGDFGLLSSASAESISRLAHVASAAGGLELSELTQSAGGLPATITVDGVDLAHIWLGPWGSGTVTSGRGFSAADGGSNVAAIDANYAAANKLSVGSTITLASTNCRVIGIVRQAQGAGSVDVYIPLGRAQALAQSPIGNNLAGQVNVIYVAADSSLYVPAVQAEISRLLPSATVTSTSDLAKAINGSLQSAASLASDLGRWVAVAALVTSFAVASLLTMAAVTRRVREFGTLKALGWPLKRIIAQIMGESAVVGIIGAAIGVAMGFAGAGLVNSVAPKLSAAVPQNTGSRQTTTVAVHLATRVSPIAVMTAVLLAIGGALLAGSLGAWRAARLQPADAFAQIE